MKSVLNRWPLGAVALALCVLVSGPAWTADNIGVAATVINKVEGVLDGNQRPIALDDSVFMSEVIRTGDASGSQMRFIDDTHLHVGEKAEIALDTMVFDPADNTTQKMVVNMTLGMFRFISGKLDKQNYELRTPTVSLGIRGTTLVIRVAEDGSTEIEVEEGEATVTPPVGPPVTLGKGLFTHVAPAASAQAPGAPSSGFMIAKARFNALMAAAGTSAPSTRTQLASQASSSYESYEEGCE
ncbi:FecR domain-containing protein [Magnetospira sp. QH-2]|uniref:FecR family protein n=1 Tax=Magnetospira sp. (strain QH-2) TaxID=1288970 RepID=UPI0003E80AC3|nr:FecR family protein [Magnetospira sp. QH-2]CCQ72865.1 exported protein of unknown function [Magnetospira sp. QH-2]